ncbi:MAG: hypothetical protein PHY99_11030, partial [Bacteroidales bacterium]|nr:hypothetical protein [Bacteroidales bacterium]
MKFTSEPVSGTTTDVFKISGNPVNDAKADPEIFYRWDWNSDGIWDTPYSLSNQVNHRFMQAGNHVITVEYSNGKKQIKTDSLMVVVQQGYSAPRPMFIPSPDTGNILTTFNFDASLTRDDEDSLDQLRFKWDFDGDGEWNTTLSGDRVATFLYKSTGVYHPILVAVDPSGRTAMYIGELTVNMEDSLIIPSFKVNDELIRVNDTLILDASASCHLKYPSHQLDYSWLLPDRLEWSLPDT